MTRPVTVRPRVPTVPCPRDRDWPVLVNPRAHSPRPLAERWQSGRISHPACLLASSREGSFAHRLPNRDCESGPSFLRASL